MMRGIWLSAIAALIWAAQQPVPAPAPQNPEPQAPKPVEQEVQPKPQAPEPQQKEEAAGPIFAPPPLPPPPPPDSNFKVSSNVDVVLLDVSVKDSAGGYVSGLTKENFVVREDGKPQQVRFFAAQDTPVTIGLIVDNSRSMGPKRPSVVVAALTFVKESHPQDEMFIVNFNDTVRLGLPPETPFSDDVQTLRSALLSIPTDGKTSLYDAILKGMEQLKLGRRDKKTLLVISDGGDNNSQHSLDDVMEAARSSLTTIYTVGIFDADDRDRNPGVLKKLASLTGGEAFFPNQLPEVVSICEKIAKDIRNRYTIGYVPENRTFDNHVRHIVVSASAPDHAKLQVHTRTSYKASAHETLSAERTKTKRKENKQ